MVRRCGEFVLERFDFSTVGTVADVGGDETVLTMLLAAHPGLTGVVFDLRRSRQRTAAETRSLLSDNGFRVDPIVRSADRLSGLVVATAD